MKSAKEIREYIEIGIVSFLRDPPDTRYQLGYLDALIALHEDLFKGDDPNGFVLQAKEVSKIARVQREPN